MIGSQVYPGIPNVHTFVSRGILIYSNSKIKNPLKVTVEEIIE